jgi:hypothetical protein
VTAIIVSKLTMTNRRLRWWRAPLPTDASWSSRSVMGGNMIQAATVTTAANTVTAATATRQFHARLIAAVAGLPTTTARLMPT